MYIRVHCFFFDMVRIEKDPWWIGHTFPGNLRMQRRQRLEAIADRRMTRRNEKQTGLNKLVPSMRARGQFPIREIITNKIIGFGDRNTKPASSGFYLDTGNQSIPLKPALKRTMATNRMPIRSDLPDPYYNPRKDEEPDPRYTEPFGDHGVTFFKPAPDRPMAHVDPSAPFGGLFDWILGTRPYVGKFDL